MTLPLPAHDITLKNLVEISLRKGFHPLTFSKLFKEYKHRAQSCGESELDLIPLYENCASRPLQLKYIYEIVVQNDLAGTFDDLTALFSLYMLRLNTNDQLVILVYFNQLDHDFPWTTLGADTTFLHAFSVYLRSLCNLSSTEQSLSARFVLMLSKFIIKLLQDSRSLDDSFGDAVLAFLEFLRSRNFDASYDFLNNFFTGFNFSTVQKDYLFHSSHAAHSSRGGIKLLHLRKILWLSHHVTVKFAPVNESFVKSFKNLLNLAAVATSATNASIAHELVVALFDCLSLSTPATAHIWTNFILVKLAEFLQLLKINQLKLANCLLNTVESVGTQHRALFIQMVRNLADLDLLKTSHLRKQLPELAENTSTSTIDGLENEYTATFHDTNPEFVSLEESGVIPFIEKIAASGPAKTRFARLVARSVHSFIADNDSLRLRRLLTSLTLNNDVFVSVVLHESPYEFVRPLVTYLDETASKPLPAKDQDGLMELGDLSGPDSSNVQDLHADMGFILVFVQAMLFKFNLDPGHFSGSSTSLKIVTTWDPIKDEAYMSNVQTAESQLNSSMNDWILSLFDSSNTDGVSDELIRSCSISELYYLIPQVFYEAVVAFNLGLIDEDSLMNGLEYFHQPFLIATLVGVLRRLASYIWSKDDTKNLAVLARVLDQLCVAELSGETKVMRDLVVQVVGGDLGRALARWSTEPGVAAVWEKLRSCGVLYDEGSVSQLVSYVVEPDPAYKFELMTMYSAAARSSCGLDWFYEQLVSLLDDIHTHKQPALAESLSYQLISICIINYALLKPATNLKKWLANLNASEKGEEVIFSRKGAQKLEIESSLKTEEKEENKFGGDLAFDSNFFGFIQEPKDEEESEKEEEKMDIDEDEASDVFISNLLVLIRFRGGEVVSKLVGSILSEAK